MTTGPESSAPPRPPRERATSTRGRPGPCLGTNISQPASSHRRSLRLGLRRRPPLQPCSHAALRTSGPWPGRPPRLTTGPSLHPPKRPDIPCSELLLFLHLGLARTTGPYENLLPAADQAPLPLELLRHLARRLDQQPRDPRLVRRVARVVHNLQPQALAPRLLQIPRRARLCSVSTIIEHSETTEARGTVPNNHTPGVGPASHSQQHSCRSP